jgi:hypothetical protein
MSRQHDVPSYTQTLTCALTTTVYSGGTKEGVTDPIGTDLKYATYLTTVGTISGNPTGTLTAQVSDSPDDAFLVGTAVWITYTPLNGGGFVSGVAPVAAGLIAGDRTFGAKMRPDFRRFRWKYVNASGAGSIYLELNVKGA